MPPRKKPITTPKAKAKSSKTTSTRQKSTAPGKPKPKTTPKAKKPSSTPAKKPTARKTATKKPTTRKKPEPKLKRKKLSHEEMFPFETFPFRLEYKDGNDIRVCHFQCEEHRDKHIKRYGLRKNQYFSDNAS